MSYHPISSDSLPLFAISYFKIRLGLLEVYYSIWNQCHRLSKYIQVRNPYFKSNSIRKYAKFVLLHCSTTFFSSRDVQSNLAILCLWRSYSIAQPRMPGGLPRPESPCVNVKPETFETCETITVLPSVFGRPLSYLAAE